MILSLFNWVGSRNYCLLYAILTLAARKCLRSGGDDFNGPFAQRRSFAEIRTYVPLVINAISSTIVELIDIRAQMLIVPGNLPIGCSAFYLTMYENKHKNDYDETGCIIWLNKFAEYYNQRLQAELNQLQELHPHANIIYADYYNAALPLYQSPTKIWFYRPESLLWRWRGIQLQCFKSVWR